MAVESRTQPPRQRGFSLIEVLVFVTIISLFFVSAAAVVSVILRNMKTTEHRLLATRYAEEAVEWLRSEKETDWNVFAAHASLGIGTDYCMDTLGWNAMPCGYTLNGIFKRVVTVTSQQTVDGYKYQVTAHVSVDWVEAGKNYQLPIDTVYSIWEQ